MGLVTQLAVPGLKTYFNWLRSSGVVALLRYSKRQVTKSAGIHSMSRGWTRQESHTSTALKIVVVGLAHLSPKEHVPAANAMIEKITAKDGEWMSLSDPLAQDDVMGYLGSEPSALGIIGTNKNEILNLVINLMRLGLQDLDLFTLGLLGFGEQTQSSFHDPCGTLHYLFDEIGMTENIQTKRSFNQHGPLFLAVGIDLTPRQIVGGFRNRPITGGGKSLLSALFDLGAILNPRPGFAPPEYLQKVYLLKREAAGFICGDLSREVFSKECDILERISK